MSIDNLIHPEVVATNNLLRDIMHRNRGPIFVLLRAESLLARTIADDDPPVALAAVYITPPAAQRLLQTRGMLTLHGHGHVDRAVMDLGGGLRWTHFDLSEASQHVASETHVSRTETVFRSSAVTAYSQRDHWHTCESLEDAIAAGERGPGLFATHDLAQRLDAMGDQTPDDLLSELGALFAPKPVMVNPTT